MVSEKCSTFAPAKPMVGVAQLVRVPDCGSEGRGFESHLPPKFFKPSTGSSRRCFFFYNLNTTKVWAAFSVLF